MSSFLWGLPGKIITLGSDDLGDLLHVGNDEEYEQSLLNMLARAWLKAQDPVVYANALEEGKLRAHNEGSWFSFCPGQLASEVLAKRLICVCTKSGEQVPAADLRLAIEKPSEAEGIEEEPRIRVLVEAVDLQTRLRTGSSETPDFRFMDLVNKSYTASAQLLLSAGLNPNTWDDEITLQHGPRVPLVAAAHYGNTTLVTALLDAGADVNGRELSDFSETDDEGKWRSFRGGNDTPLIEAIKRKDLELVKILLENKADVNVEGPCGETPLMNAVDRGCEDLVRLLMASGANMEATDDGYGHTALLRAAEGRDIKMMKTLLELGANTNVRDRYGSSFLDILQKQGPDVRLLLGI